VTATLATIDGVTREQAHENYMHALAQLVTYVFGIDRMALQLFARSDADCYLQAYLRVPSPDGWRAVVGFQAREYVKLNPPRLRTIELVLA
jgi:hypothetical protein